MGDASPLAFTRAHRPRREENFLVIGREHDHSALQEDVDRLSRAGGSVYAVDIPSLNKREGKLNPKKHQEENKLFRSPRGIDYSRFFELP